MSVGPLFGLRVLDIGTVYAAPFAASLLGDLGADVLKLELPGRGDPLRDMQPLDGNDSLTWAAVARNKRAITLDLRDSEGQEIFCRLLAGYDVLLENFRPGTLDRWGLDLARLRAASPEIVVARISGYGQTGPYRDKAGFGTPATAFAGYAHISGHPDHAPTLPPISLADYMTGLFATIGVLAALHHRDASGGPGQEVDVALYESMFRVLEAMAIEYDRLGVVRGRTGNELAASVPAGLYKAKDGTWLVLTTSTDRTFDRLARSMSRPELSTDARYSTNRARVERRGEVDRIVADWFAEHNAAEIVDLLDANGVPVAPVNTVADIFTDVHFAARDMLVEVNHPRLGSLRLPGVVPKLSRTPGSVRSAGPDLGEHNAEVYGEIGLTAEDLERLMRKGVI